MLGKREGFERNPMIPIVCGTVLRFTLGSVERFLELRLMCFKQTLVTICYLPMVGLRK